MFARPDCENCGGRGLILIDDLNTRLCMCAYAIAMASHLGPEIAQASNLTSTPLYVRSDEPGAAPDYDRTTENVFVRGSWAELLPHFKYTLVAKGLNFRFKVTTDEKLKTIYVGDESYKARSRLKRDDVETYNSLADFVTDCHLLIIRLGFLGYKNIAAPGILKEALMHREVARKPTWLVEDPERVFGPGNHSYSDEVWAYIIGHFKVNLDLKGEKPTELPTMQWTPPTVGRSQHEAASSATMAVDESAGIIESVEDLFSPKPKFKPKPGGKWKPNKPKMDDEF